jgi:hypothetical protein
MFGFGGRSVDSLGNPQIAFSRFEPTDVCLLLPTKKCLTSGPDLQRQRALFLVAIDEGILRVNFLHRQAVGRVCDIDHCLKIAYSNKFVSICGKVVRLRCNPNELQLELLPKPPL